MHSYKRDILISIKEDLQNHLSEEDQIIDSFEVVPIDHNVFDRSTPLLFLSRDYLCLAYDEILEMYDLNDLEIVFVGEMPRFSIVNQLLERNLVYQDGIDTGLLELRDSEYTLKLSIIEKDQIPKDFVNREGPLVQKSIKTWAMGRIIMNQKTGMQYDPRLKQMLLGNFVGFNQRTVLYFAVFSSIYLLMKVTLIPALPDIFGSVFDVLFALTLLFMGIWLYLSIGKALERDSALFRTYTPIDERKDL